MRAVRTRAHPTDAVLDRLIDTPAGVADADRRHVAGCSDCLDRLAARGGEAAAGAQVVGGDVPVGRGTGPVSTAPPAGRGPIRPTTSDVAWRSGVLAPGTRQPAGAGRWRAIVRRPAVAAVAVVAVLTGAGAAAANDWVQIFRTERVAAVGFMTSDLVALPDLSEYGDLVVTNDVEVHSVRDAATAAAETGLDVPEVTSLPRGVRGEPVHQVGGEVRATFTFSTDRATRAAAAAGAALPTAPPGLDGSSVELRAGPATAAVWSSEGGRPSLVVGRTVAPTASSSGVPFETVRDHLLSLPGVPDDVARQLRAFRADGSTLPLPVPGDRLTTSTAMVDGRPATVVATRDRTLAAVVWVDGGILTAVAGALDAGEVLSVARGLR